MNYQNTQLWKKSLANEEKYGYKELRDMLISEFLKTHENATIILSKIRFS